MKIIFHIFCCFAFLNFSVTAFEDYASTNDIASYSEVKYCLYQKRILPQEYFNEATGHGCYEYGAPSRFKNKYKYVTIKRYYLPLKRNFTIPAGLYNENNKILLFTFNYKNETVKNIIAKSFKSAKFYQKWLSCCEAAENCCKNVMTNEKVFPNKNSCPAIWDAWDCFDSIPANTNASNYCPNWATNGDPPCLKKNLKQCLPNGTWVEKTDYGNCVYSSTIINRIIVHASMLFTSTLICLPAIIIFFSYSALRITRVILHRNLLIAIAVKNILVILSKLIITLDALDKNVVMTENGVPCRILAFFERASINAMYACMLVDGFYLHKIIVTVFRKDLAIYWFYTAIAVLSFVPILIWAALKTYFDNTKCWVVDESWHYWIIDGSRYAMLGINLLLFMDIIRVLIWKLQRNKGSQHTKYYYVSIRGIEPFKNIVLKAFASTLRATFILLPLFGIQFIMMSQRPVNVDCVWDDTFYYISYTIDAAQGILVSFLYCYFNKEVQTLIKRTYQRLITRWNDRRPTINLRRSTTATYVSENLNAPRESKSKFKGMKNLEPIAEEEISQNIKVQSWIQKNFTS